VEAAADISFAVLVNEMKDPAFVELEVEQQPAHRERLQRLPVGALALNQPCPSPPESTLYCR
jgi:hypothetical protein